MFWTRFISVLLKHSLLGNIWTTRTRELWTQKNGLLTFLLCCFSKLLLHKLQVIFSTFTGGTTKALKICAEIYLLTFFLPQVLVVFRYSHKINSGFLSSCDNIGNCVFVLISRRDSSVMMRSSVLFCLAVGFAVFGFGEEKGGWKRNSVINSHSFFPLKRVMLSQITCFRNGTFHMMRELLVQSQWYKFVIFSVMFQEILFDLFFI